MSADWISLTADARWHTSVYIWYNVECKPTAAVNSGQSQQQSTPAPSATFPSSCSAANHSSITGPAAAHFFTSRLSVLAVSTAPAGARDSEWPTVADGGRLCASEPGCLPSFLPSSRPLCSHQEMSFSSSVSSALYSASLSNNKDRIERRKKKSLRCWWQQNSPHLFPISDTHAYLECTSQWGQRCYTHFCSTYETLF